ncbi:hypothetical protein [Selenomonas ruminantium]|uniref:hypothetical protein n=1 Tax=Selenomonas ruminantium TaxID=971 RepID=UPI0026EA5686|nr:hypothetical protein [Selenomonas ruminantium]
MERHAQEIAKAAASTRRIANRNPGGDVRYKTNAAIRRIAQLWEESRGGWVVAKFSTMRALYGPLFHVPGDDDQRCIFGVGGSMRYQIIPFAYLDD